jgi:TPR repeat protein
MMRPKMSRERLFEKAQEGDPEAMGYLASLYMDGRDERVPKDEEKARKWLNRAAKKGDVRAMHDLGVHYFETGDAAKGVAFYEQAAAKGSAACAAYLSEVYMNGEGGVKPNQV